MGELFAVLSAIGYSISFVFVRLGTTHESQNNGVFLSMIITCVISGIIVLIRGMINGFSAWNSVGTTWFILAGFLSLFLGRTFLYLSIQLVGSVRASAIKRLNPFLTVLLSILLLNEPLTFSLVTGMLLILFSFLYLIVKPHFEAVQKSESVHVKGTGYVFGPISAFFYACGFIATKKGLEVFPDPFYGIMTGALVGLAIFLVVGIFKPYYRISIKQTFESINKWLIFAGVGLTAGQILFFAAIIYIELSRVIMIMSLELVFTIALSVLFLKTREMLTPAVITASLASMFGSMIIAVN